MVWGIFRTKKGVSWEGHLSGATIGFVLSIILLKKGPQKKYDWDEEDNQDSINYIYP